MKPELIPQWRLAPQMWVVQILATIAIVQAVWAELPPEVLAGLPPNLVHWITVALAVLGIVARVIRQASMNPPAEPAQPEDDR